MAKKKVAKKKTPPVTGRKVARKTTAKKPTRKTTTKKVAKTVAKKTTTKKVAKTVAKKTAATASRGEKTATKAKAPAETTAEAPAEAPAKTTRKKITVGKVTTAAKKAAAKAARSSPDANGYVIINGRRVRMMSTSVPPVVTKKPRSRVKAAAEPAPETANQKPIKTKLKKKELDHYRELLLERRQELVGDLSAMEKQALQATSSNVSHMPIHMADIGTDTYDQDFMLGLAENERKRLREIDAALVRIEDRTYGVCEMTSKVIPKARLNAKPWARYTIEAARQIESGVGE
jgi:DnaK suppressor protein